MKTQYRIYETKSVRGDVYFGVQEKCGWFGSWYHVSKSLQETLEEAWALKKLLEMGESQYSIFKPSARLKMLEAGETNINWEYHRDKAKKP